ncbi:MULTISPECIES: spore germination protein [Bacillaceae]|uniref:spore germination protein n=1 Tax=Bacillaceae TaxID=186817 RepID=UPI001BDF4D53|nr:MULTISPECIES: spore germination protein [Bacillaceae]MDX8361330.1 spore germination protein [Cytobacillus sp. IB215316]MDX8364534.1 spore germination protein [Cytobacillus sp. IB215665]
MPSIVGPVNINTVSGGVINFGDSFYISPKTQEKSYTGSGSSVSGNFFIVTNGISFTNTGDPDLVDQPQTANA